MGGSQFRFRHFTIRQDRCAMKVSTDSVILGCLTDPPPRGKILDVGTGTGLLALMMAFRGGESVDALEIEPEAAAQAAENVDASGMGGRIHVITGDFRKFRPEVPYRLIISNPPYFPPGVAASSRARDPSPTGICCSKVPPCWKKGACCPCAFPPPPSPPWRTP